MCRLIRMLVVRNPPCDWSQLKLGERKLLPEKAYREYSSGRELQAVRGSRAHFFIGGKKRALKPLARALSV